MFLFKLSRITATLEIVSLSQWEKFIFGKDIINFGLFKTIQDVKWNLPVGIQQQ